MFFLYLKRKILIFEEGQTRSFCKVFFHPMLYPVTYGQKSLNEIEVIFGASMHVFKNPGTIIRAFLYVWHLATIDLKLMWLFGCV